MPGGTVDVGVDGGDASLDSDSLGKRRFLGGATISLNGGDSATTKTIHLN